MTTLMDGLGYFLMAGLIFFPVLFLSAYCFYEALGWRQILADWTYPTEQVDKNKKHRSEIDRPAA